jgi:GNAT superfamily N-acetyltransferase
MIAVRPVEPDDEPFLWDMSWEAAAVDAGVRARGRDAAFVDPHLRRYLDGWGRPGDAGVVAVDERGRRVGAAWVRLLSASEPGYGFVAPEIPELGIGVVPEARGRGVGSALLTALLAMARERRWPALSLSVDRQNPARRLYERMGFQDAGISPPDDSSVTMIARWDIPPSCDCPALHDQPLIADT